jgi:low density lipoprotein receptor-related protein 5/6
MSRRNSTAFAVMVWMLGAGLSIAHAQKMYWTDSFAARIQRADLDGSNVEDVSPPGLDSPMGIALDTVAGKMYWTENQLGKILRANLDGSSVEELVTGLGGPIGIALDLTAGKM